MGARDTEGGQLSPTTLVWEDTGLGYTDWLRTMLGPALLGYYGDIGWDGWRFLASKIDASKSMFFYPPRFTAEGKDPLKCFKGTVPVDESWDTQQDLAKQLTSARAAKAHEGEEDGD